jgi:hypothetical protein
VIATSALVGLTDLDALTCLSRGAFRPRDAGSMAAVALVAGILSNTLLKLSVALVMGRGWFRTATAAALGAMTIAIVATLFVAR